jgi:hypothetical protein
MSSGREFERPRPRPRPGYFWPLYILGLWLGAGYAAYFARVVDRVHRIVRRSDDD